MWVNNKLVREFRTSLENEIKAGKGSITITFDDLFELMKEFTNPDIKGVIVDDFRNLASRVDPPLLPGEKLQLWLDDHSRKEIDIPL